MAISRQQLAKELEPGLNALFGLEYQNYENQHTEIYDIENSDRAFEEEVMLSGFANAAVKAEGSAVTFDTANEAFTSRYTHETIALAFAITEEAIEDNLYDRIATRYTKALARSMAQTKQIKAANVLNNGFDSSFPGGDGKELFATDHPTQSAGSLANELSTSADLSETSLEQAMIDIAAFNDERGFKIRSPARVGTADNDLNALSSKGMLPQGYVVNNYLTDTDAFFIKTDVPNGMKMFNRANLKTAMEGDFDTGNVRYKARERYSFGFSDWRGMFGSPGA